MYRHPQGLAESLDYISNVLQKASLHKKSIFLPGDRNDDLLQPQAKLTKILNEAKFNQIINKPTRMSQLVIILVM